MALLLFGVCLVSAQQQLTVSGVVTDASDGSPIIGASVLVKGSAKGTVTDVNGKYTLNTVQGSSLVFSFIGMEKQEISVRSKVVNVQLKSDSHMLNEVVAIGYGTAKRVDLTTAQSSVSAKEMDKTVNTTLEQALQGRAAGVYITQNSGQPGGGISVAVRGVSSINGSTEPLYVIDGIQIPGSQVSYGSTSSSNPLSGLNPSDISDVQILQGPSATALYGSRATNGVVLITTKRGQAGDAKITYNYSYSLQTPPARMAVMDLPQYAQMVNEFHAIVGGTTPTEFLDPSILGKGTDWQSELFRNSGMQKHQISLSGGSEKTTYYVSGEYLNQDGVAVGSGFNRLGVRANLDTKPRKWLKMGLNTSFNQTFEKLTSSSEDVINNALQLTPQTPVKNIDGTYGGGNVNNPTDQYAPVNPIAIANLVTNTNLRRQFNGGGNLDIDILPGLTFRTTLNANTETQNSIYYRPTYSIGWAKNTIATMSDYNGVSTYYNLNELLQYVKKFGNHNFDLMVSHEAQGSTYKGNGANITTFITNDVIDVNAGDQTTATVSGGHNSWGMESYLGRLNYNYNERYILSASVRSDGSSNFGANNRWGTFPAISGAWRVSKEHWYNVSFMNELKLRLETGTTGNQGGGGIYSSMSTAPSQWGTGFLPSIYANPSLQWESTSTNNIGMNASFFNNRIQVEADYYHKVTDNLLMQAALPAYMGTRGNGGLGAPTVNLGSLQNNGWAITLTTTNINTKNFKWESNFNISGFRTKILKFNNDAASIDRTSWWMGNWTQRSSVGQAPWLFLGYKTDGIFTSVDEINKSAVPVDNNGVRLTTDVNHVWVGDVKYKDMNGDGVIDVKDLTTIGNPWPKSFGGFTNTFTYKGFELSVLLTYSYGNDIYNYVKMTDSNPQQINIGRNLLTSAENYARLATDANGNVYLTNPTTNLPRITYSTNGNWTRFSDRWVEDGSYIKIKNVSLAYNLPYSLLAKQKVVKDVRLMFSAQNLYTLTKYSGYDPEVGAYVGNNSASNNQAIGVDNGRYPLTAVYTFNIMVNF
ncbi:MAG: TonB-dependent receptor [Paludibacter sp.]|nr:TonB-dependent receptor [Paludibacter sp.]